MWQEHLDWWEGDVPGISSEMDSFTDYVLELLRKGKDENEFSRIFALIEQLLQKGNSEAKDAIATCFLENLINHASSGEISSFSFIVFLGNESKGYCKAWDEFTGVKTRRLWEDSCFFVTLFKKTTLKLSLHNIILKKLY